MDPNCAGKRKRVTTADLYAINRFHNSFSACNGLWDDSSVMTYQPGWGSFKVAPGYAVNTFLECSGLFLYGPGWMQWRVTSAAGCVSPTYRFVFLQGLKS